jgi:glutaminyl-peptide cyclotransferase
VRPLVVVLLAQLVIGLTFVILALTGAWPFTGKDDPSQQAARAALRADDFDGKRAFGLLERQVRMGPRPAGSRTSRRLAAELRRLLPRGRYQRVPGGLRNVVGVTPGRDPKRYVVVGAHYDTKDVPGFVGANDGASGTAAVVELARSFRARQLRPTVVWILFDGEESPRGTPDAQFERRGLRGSKVAARRYDDAEAMVLLDFVGDKDLRIPRESNSNLELWSRLRGAARHVGASRTFPASTQGPVSDDHVPFLRRRVPAIDLIDFDFDCFHRTCDDLSAVSQRSLDAVGETVHELLARL